MQFGKKWMKKFRGLQKLDEAASWVQFGGQTMIFNSTISRLAKKVFVSPVNYISHLIWPKLLVILETIQIKNSWTK